jgi:hypothetical protein
MRDARDDVSTRMHGSEDAEDSNDRWEQGQEPVIGKTAS